MSATGEEETFRRLLDMIGVWEGAQARGAAKVIQAADIKAE
jgi:hypothetical protein